MTKQEECKEKEEKKDYTGYKPSIFFWIFAVCIVVLLSVFKASILGYVFGYSLLFLVFLFDVEQNEKKKGKQ